MKLLFSLILFSIGSVLVVSELGIIKIIHHTDEVIHA